MLILETEPNEPRISHIIYTKTNSLLRIGTAVYSQLRNHTGWIQLHISSPKLLFSLPPKPSLLCNKVKHTFKHTAHSLLLLCSELLLKLINKFEIKIPSGSLWVVLYADFKEETIFQTYEQQETQYVFLLGLG